MTIDHRLIDELAKEFIVSRSCGCAWLLRTHDQVAFCPEHK